MNLIGSNRLQPMAARRLLDEAIRGLGRVDPAKQKQSELHQALKKIDQLIRGVGAADPAYFPAYSLERLRKARSLLDGASEEGPNVVGGYFELIQLQTEWREYWELGS